MQKNGGQVSKLSSGEKSADWDRREAAPPIRRRKDNRPVGMKANTILLQRVEDEEGLKLKVRRSRRGIVVTSRSTESGREA